MAENKRLDHVNVEGVNWVSAVVAAEKSEKDFVEKHMKDAGTYRDYPADKKTNALKLAYKLACENAPEAMPKAGA